MPIRNEVQAPGMLRIGDERDVQVTSWEIEKEDAMKLKPLYEALYYFLREEGYTHPQTKDDLIEDLYWERWVPGGSKEQHIWWRLAREVNPYIRYFLQLDFQTLYVTKAEIPYKNKKISGERIDLIMRGKLYLQFDYNNKFRNSIGWQFRKAFFGKMYQRELEEHKQLLLQFNDRLTHLIRSFMDVQTEHEAIPNFYPQLGYRERT